MSGAAGLIVFDVDGTLVDSQAHILAAVAQAFTAEGLTVPSREATLSIVGLSLPEAMRVLAPGLSEARRAAIVQTYKDGYSVLRAGEMSPLYPGAAAALDRLLDAPETLLGVATGKSRRGLTHVLEAHGLTGHFVTSQVADDHPSKPHPSMLHAALSETGTRAGCAVMVGDTTYDIEMGRAAGVATIGVTWGYHPPADLRRAGADRIAGDFEELVAILEDMGLGA